jgi:hypothetical protein
MSLWRRLRQLVCKHPPSCQAVTSSLWTNEADWVRCTRCGWGRFVERGDASRPASLIR